MDRLIGTHLLEDGLVALDTAELVARYNHCLEIAGIDPVNLDRLDIDGAGWSPQVAELKGDHFYLCHSLANPLAIIVTPRQFNKPVYLPAYSWMRRLLRSIFDRNFREIADITATHGMVLDFENQLGHFEGPADLLLLTSIAPVPNTGGLTEAAEEQKALVQRFLEDQNCLDADLQAALKTHGTLHGDLRKRRVVIESPDFQAFQDFYTVAFGGAAVLRGVNGEDVLVLEDEATFKSIDETSLGARLFYLGAPDHDLFQFLLSADWLEVPTERFPDPKVLEKKHDMLLAWSLYELAPDMLWDKLTKPQRRALSQKHRQDLPPEFVELERLIANLSAGRQSAPLSIELRLYLAEPAAHLHPSTREVLWILLTRREPRNLLELYTHDKNYFKKLYDTWSEGKREWATTYLVANYVKRMNQP